MPNTRDVLAAWFNTEMRAWNAGGQQLTFNMADLCKSYIAATTQGIVMDLKIGPSPHIKKYVDSGIFSTAFIGCKRAGTIENQCMGSMSVDDTKRTRYGNGFELALFSKDRFPSTLKNSPYTEWFPQATAAHNRAMGQNNNFALPQGLKGDWFDIGNNGKAKHESQLGIMGATFEGILEDEKCYGPIRIFKREDDQTNKSDKFRTTDEQRLKMQELTFSELAQASVKEGGIDVTAEGMPPITDMLELLSLTKKR